MSRSGYSDDCEGSYGLWRGAVAAGLRGKRGQRLLRDLIAALDAMPTKRLIRDGFRSSATGAVCALGAVCEARGVSTAPLDAIDPEDDHLIAPAAAVLLDVPKAVAAEVMCLNDDYDDYDGDAFLPDDEHQQERRWKRMRAWADAHLIEWDDPTEGGATK